MSTMEQVREAKRRMDGADEDLRAHVERTETQPPDRARCSQNSNHLPSPVWLALDRSMRVLTRSPIDPTYRTNWHSSQLCQMGLYGIPRNAIMEACGITRKSLNPATLRVPA